MELKPQDTLLALKYWSLKYDNLDNSVREISDAIGISAGEVSKGARRLIKAHLVVERSGRFYAETGALSEWLCYGVRYAYPQETVGYGRGVATSWNCALLESEMSPPIPAQVWPYPGGETEGALIRPLHASVPMAALRDENIYLALSLLEAIRGGKPRELKIARGLLTKLIRGK